MSKLETISKPKVVRNKTTKASTIRKRKEEEKFFDLFGEANVLLAKLLRNAPGPPISPRAKLLWCYCAIQSGSEAFHINHENLCRTISENASGLMQFSNYYKKKLSKPFARRSARRVIPFIIAFTFDLHHGFYFVFTVQSKWFLLLMLLAHEVGKVFIVGRESVICCVKKELKKRKRRWRRVELINVIKECCGCIEREIKSCLLEEAFLLV